MTASERAGRHAGRPPATLQRHPLPGSRRHKAAARPHAGLPEDTINVLDTEHIQHIVRLAGINAPERQQPFSEVAHQHLAALVLLRDVVVD
jgi:endonuclease YncB( thermonuclease family)